MCLSLLTPPNLPSCLPSCCDQFLFCAFCFSSSLRLAYRHELFLAPVPLCHCAFSPSQPCKRSISIDPPDSPPRPLCAWCAHSANREHLMHFGGRPVNLLASTFFLTLPECASEAPLSHTTRTSPHLSAHVCLFTM